jgi:hypothetical protein
VEFEVVETYELFAEKRYVLRLKGTNITVNVAASSAQEAIERAKKLLAP